MSKPIAAFKVEYWGDDEPSVHMLEKDLEHIQQLISEGYTSGEAGTDEDWDGRGWWTMEGFDDSSD